MINVSCILVVFICFLTKPTLGQSDGIEQCYNCLSVVKENKTDFLVAENEIFLIKISKDTLNNLNVFLENKTDDTIQFDSNSFNYDCAESWGTMDSFYQCYISLMMYDSDPLLSIHDPCVPIRVIKGKPLTLTYHSFDMELSETDLFKIGYQRLTDCSPEYKNEERGTFYIANFLKGNKD